MFFVTPSVIFADNLQVVSWKEYVAVSEIVNFEHLHFNPTYRTVVFLSELHRLDATFQELDY